MILVCHVILQDHVIKALGIIQKVRSLRRGGRDAGEIIEKRTKTNRRAGEGGGEVLACLYVHL